MLKAFWNLFSSNRRALLLILKILVYLEELCYRNISLLATIAEGGVHPKHRLMNYHQFFIDNIDLQDSVLDIGSGNGFLTHNIAMKARSVTAIDIDKGNIESAKKNFNKENIKYICGCEKPRTLTH